MPAPTEPASPSVLILGIAQDAGYPQAGCRRPCCAPAWSDPARRRHAACAAVVDPASGARWMIDATPDFREQLRMLDDLAPAPDDAGSPGLAGIFLTHGHIGHYTGLMHLGREAMGARGVPVYAMPRMAAFLIANHPWAELVQGGTIVLHDLQADITVGAAPGLSLIPFLVPHRDEHTETVGFRIQGPNRQVLYLPDIDAWEAWDARGMRIEDVLAAADVALLDGTFFTADEVPGRSLATVPHPLIEATLRRLAALPAAERCKVRFIHMNHSNPALVPDGAAARAIAAAGCGLARERERIAL